MIQNFWIYKFKTGNTIFDEGDELDPGIYIILFGSVSLIKNQKSFPVRFHRVFGEECILKSFTKRRYKAVARENTKVFRIEFEELKKLNIVYPEETRDI